MTYRTRNDIHSVFPPLGRSLLGAGAVMICAALLPQGLARPALANPETTASAALSTSLGDGLRLGLPAGRVSPVSFSASAGQGVTTPPPGSRAGMLAPLLPQNAELAALRAEAFGSYALPIGPWEGGSMLTRRTEGRVEMTSWQMADPGTGTLGIFSPLREALAKSGWRILYECDTAACGGFDFRYSTQVLQEPAMHVDLGDFRFLSARRNSPQGEEVLSLLVSRSSGSGQGYVQAIEVTPVDPQVLAGAPPQGPEAGGFSANPSSKSPLAPDQARLAQSLEAGALVLEGLTFASGATTLESEDAGQLADLAAYLAAHPERQIALVGHTDASGSLETNVTLSRQRAETVRARLISHYQANGGQITALGAGFMAPRAANLTEEGRAKNRRVEAILTSTK